MVSFCLFKNSFCSVTVKEKIIFMKKKYFSLKRKTLLVVIQNI